MWYKPYIGCTSRPHWKPYCNCQYFRMGTHKLSSVLTQSTGTCTIIIVSPVKCFCAVIVTAKCLADELIMHYFHILSSADEGFTPRPHQHSIPGSCWGTSVPRPLISPPPPLEKIPWAPMALRESPYLLK